jgi:hypothetical protein
VVAEVGQISEAARRLHLSQRAASRHCQHVLSICQFDPKRAIRD